MEYGIINGYDNHLIDILDFETNLETTFWFKWFNGNEWIVINPFTEWVLHFGTNNLKLLIGHNFEFNGDIDLIIYANINGEDTEVYNGTLSI
jgi:hypothetical protein